MPDRDRRREKQEFLHLIDRKGRRKVRARRDRGRSLWYGMGLFGLVGWSVAVPTLVGLALGLWLDGRIDSRFSWTLTLLVGGLIAGCVLAWYWVSRERESIEKEREEDE
jgi:ATP synthase protein I